MSISITDLLSIYNLNGLVVGLATFLIIGIFHPIVIKCEYYFGVRCWWWFLILGIAMCGVSVYVSDTTLSILAGVVAFSSFWTIKEIFEQRERVRKDGFLPIPAEQQKTPPQRTQLPISRYDWHC